MTTVGAGLQQGDPARTQSHQGDRSIPAALPLRIGTRPSALAMAQSSKVAERLRAAGHPCELVEVTTPGDRSSAPVAELGVGVFVSALREALAAGEVDVAVHSYKDLPTAPDPRLVIAAVPQREDPRDALVARDGMVLGELPHGARVGTGSPRRKAQLTRSAWASTSSPSAATSTRGSARSPRASWTRSWWPRPGCGGSAGSTRPRSCSTRCRCSPPPRRARSPSSAAQKSARPRGDVGRGAGRRVHPRGRHGGAGGAGRARGRL